MVTGLPTDQTRYGTPLAFDLYRVLIEAAGVLHVAHNRPFEHVQ